MTDQQLPPALAGDQRFVWLNELLTENMQRLDLNTMLVYLIDLVQPSVLPILAEQFSMLEEAAWSVARSDDDRRALIKTAIMLHRYKGTPWAIKQALAVVGIDRITLNEHPDGAHWAEFDAEIDIVDRPLSEATYLQITRLIGAYKPVRSRLRKLLISVATHGTFKAACVTFAGDIISIQPYQLTDISAPYMRPTAGIGGQDWGTTTIYPRSL
jgi:phage tail P2-like protein